MEVTFDKVYLQELYTNGRATDKKHRFQPEIARKYKYCIDTLLLADGLPAILRVKSLNYEVLKGDKQGLSSIRVNQQYRIEFTVKESVGESIVTICNIIELSNHYK